MARLPRQKKDVILSRARLSELDADDSLKRIAQGSLPGWCRTWCRDSLPGKLSMLDAQHLPMLYTRHGARLPESMGVGLIRALSVKNSAKEFAEVCQEYVHPVALARFSDHAISQWCRVVTSQEPPARLVPYLWMPQLHVYFGDLYGLERAMFEAILPCVAIKERVVWRESAYRHVGLTEQFLQGLCAALRDGPSPGSALLVLLAHEHRVDKWFLGVLANVFSRDPHFNHVLHPSRYSWSNTRHHTIEMTGISIDYMAEIIEALGFDGEGRAYVLNDTQRWVGAELFERFMGHDEDDDTTQEPDNTPAPDSVSESSFHVAMWVFTQIFTQTGSALEEAASARTMWHGEAWRALFLEQRYFAFWAQRVLWSRSRAGEDDVPFRVCEDLTCADQSDEPLDVLALDEVSVIKSDALSEQDRVRWSELLASYEVITAFEQL